MSLPAVVDLEAYRGDSWSQQFKLYSALDVPLDLSGSTVAAQAIGPTATITLTVTPDVTDHSLITIALPADAEAGVYGYDIQVTDPAAVVTTWIRGELSIVQDVTP